MWLEATAALRSFWKTIIGVLKQLGDVSKTQDRATGGEKVSLIIGPAVLWG